MSTATHGKPPRAAVAWSVFMVASWLVFVGVAATLGDTLSEAWSAIRDLPLLVEAIVWFLALPWMIALAVWESGWSEPARIAGLACIAIAWTLLSVPRANP